MEEDLETAAEALGLPTSGNKYNYVSLVHEDDFMNMDGIKGVSHLVARPSIALCRALLLLIIPRSNYV